MKTRDVSVAIHEATNAEWPAVALSSTAVTAPVRSSLLSQQCWGILPAFKDEPRSHAEPPSAAVGDELFTSCAEVPRKERTSRNGGANRSNRPFAASRIGPMNGREAREKS
jgi:hypothetical protein